MSETVVLSIVTGILSLVSTIFTGIMAYLVIRLNMKVDNASTSIGNKIDNNSVYVGDKLNDMEALGKTTHVLVNSTFEAYRQHQLSQNTVDKMEAKGK